MYNDQIKQVSELNVYRRKTFLDAPVDSDQPEIKVHQFRDSTGNFISDTKLSKEKQIDDYEIKVQFIAGAQQEYEQTKQFIEMSITADIHRLCQMYLESVNKLKLSLPTQNVECRTFEKTITQFREKELNLHPSDSEIFTNKSKLKKSKDIKQSYNLISEKVTNKEGEFNNQSFISIQSYLEQKTANCIGKCCQSSSSLLEDINQAKVNHTPPLLDPTNQIIQQEQCIPKLLRMDLEHPDHQKNDVKQLWQSLMTELQTNPTVSADLVNLIIQEGLGNKLIYNNDQSSRKEKRNRTILVNMSQFFWDNIHTEERLAFHEKSNFLSFFSKFALEYMSKNKFSSDEIGNVFICDLKLKVAIQCLFEGLTRKIPAFNFLQFIYKGSFSRIDLFQLNQNLQSINQKAQELKNKQVQSCRNNKVDSQNITSVIHEKKTAPVEKCWLSRMKDKFWDKDETGDKIKEIKPKNDSENKSKSYFKQYEEMVKVYGGDSYPFLNLNKDESTFQLNKSDQIQQKIAEVQPNNNKFLMDEFQGFKPKHSQKIIIDEKSIQELFFNQNDQNTVNSSANEEKSEKNLTYYIKNVVQKNIEQLLHFSQKIPYAIRALLKIIIIRSRGSDDFNSKLKLDQSEIHMIAEFLIAGWLNTGYRNPKCFGIKPIIENELELEFIFFQALRIVFEHTMLMQYIPDDIGVEGFNIDELNRFIKTMSSQVFVFWIKLINIDISEINILPQPSIVNSSIMRVDDLDMIFLYCQILEQKTNSAQQNTESKNRDELKWEQFYKIMKQLRQKVQIEDIIIFNDSKPLIPIDSNNIGKTIQRHLGSLLQLPIETKLRSGDNEDESIFEYYLLFLKRKSQKEILDNLQEWDESCNQEIQQMNNDFVTKNFIISEVPTQTNSNSSKQVQQIYQQKQSQFSQEIQLKTTSFNEGLTFCNDLKVLKLHKMTFGHNTLYQIEKILMNIFNSLRVLLDNSNLQFDCFSDQKNYEEIKDIIKLLNQAQKVNKIQPQANILISVGCNHIIRMLKSLNLEGQFDIQNQILKQFVCLMEHKVQKSRSMLDNIIIKSETLAIDVECFELNISNLKQFHTKFQNNLKFIETISRYNPQICLLNCFKLDLNNNPEKQGLLLNLQCTQHRTNLPMSTYMLFGVVNRKAQEVVNQQLNSIEEEKFVSEEDLKIRMVRDKRIACLHKHYFDHEQFTFKLQNQKSTKLQDQEIKQIQTLIQYYTSQEQGRPYLKTLIMADNQKYKQLANIYQNELKHFKTEQEKFEFLSLQEPIDYMNLVSTYTMYLQYISVYYNNSTNNQYIDETNDKNFFTKQHYDFLQFDLTSKAIRYQMHEYIIRCFHKTIFGSKQHFQTDIKVQELILAKQDDPNWVLTSEKSKQESAKGIKSKDFTDTPEWCDPQIYSASLKTLLRVAEEETPHLKAIYIEDAVTQAINAMKIVTPYKRSDAIGEPERQRVMRHLILEVSKIYEKANTNSRLYSQLLYILLFNLPQNEILNYSLIKQQNQKWLQDQTIERNFSKLPAFNQHQLMLGKIGDRNKVYEWLGIFQGLISEDLLKRKSKAQFFQRDIPYGDQTPKNKPNGK